MKSAFLIAAAALALPATANAATIVNGSFESASVNPGGGFLSLGFGSTAITGWTVGGDGVDYIGGYWQAADGTRSIDLSRNGAGSISQTLSTVIGQSYTVTFALAGNPDGGPGTKVLLTLGTPGGLTQVDTFNVTGANTRANMGWQTYSYTFRAASTSTTLTFESATNTAFGPALDQVAIAAVPEPASWALMIAGVGFTGGALRTRRRNAAFA